MYNQQLRFRWPLVLRLQQALSQEPVLNNREEQFYQLSRSGLTGVWDFGQVGVQKTTVPAELNAGVDGGYLKYLES